MFLNALVTEIKITNDATWSHPIRKFVVMRWVASTSILTPSP
jgi:hypothetical protein